MWELLQCVGDTVRAQCCLCNFNSTNCVAWDWSNEVLRTVSVLLRTGYRCLICTKDFMYMVSQ